MKSIVKWAIAEIAIECKQAYRWDAFPLQAEFKQVDTASSFTVDAYWAGGCNWVVRFTLPEEGEWRWRLIGEAANNCIGEAEGAVHCITAEEQAVHSNVNLRGHVRISSSGRYFEYADGKPLFWVGDTNWNMMGKACGLEGPFQQYLRDRKSKGFNVIQTQFFNVFVRNEGGRPFPNYSKNELDFSELNCEYFRYVDTRVKTVWDEGFTIAAHPTWVGKKEMIPPEPAIHFTRYLLARYGAFNLLWSLAGEYQYSYPVGEKPGLWNTADWNRLGREAARHNVYRHPITIHPSSRYRLDDPATWPSEAHRQSSSGEFHNEAWLDFNWIQTGHLESMLWFVPYRLEQDYNRVPVKPVLHSEGWYERHGRGGRTGDVYDTRWQAWVSVLSGSCGHTYGAEGVWSFHDLERPDAPLPYDTYDPVSWQEGIALPGSNNFLPFRQFFEALEWWKLQPHRDWVRIDGRVPDVQKLSDPHCAVHPHQLAVVYVPRGNAGAKLQLLHIGAAAYEASWIDPRSGKVISIGHAVDSTGEDQWQAPPVPDDEDWALLLTIK